MDKTTFVSELIARLEALSFPPSEFALNSVVAFLQGLENKEEGTNKERNEPWTTEELEQMHLQAQQAQDHIQKEYETEIAQWQQRQTVATDGSVKLLTPADEMALVPPKFIGTARKFTKEEMDVFEKWLPPQLAIFPFIRDKHITMPFFMSVPNQNALQQNFYLSSIAVFDTGAPNGGIVFPVDDPRLGCIKGQWLNHGTNMIFYMPITVEIAGRIFEKVTLVRHKPWSFVSHVPVIGGQLAHRLAVSQIGCEADELESLPVAMRKRGQLIIHNAPGGSGWISTLLQLHPGNNGLDVCNFTRL